VTYITAANLRRLIPGGAVAAVLAFSWFAAEPSFAANGGTGYNCGVKGIGYHDHGKACPNRPFPGQGVGLSKFGIDIVGHSKDQPKDSAVVTTSTAKSEAANTKSTPESGDEASASDKVHGHGNGHGKGKGHNR
jgi:hypothetical protein